MKSPRWLERRKTDPELPYKPPIPFLENYSNGEFFYEQTARDRKMKEVILQRADDKARKLGMDRRAFLASTMGMATSLGVVDLLSGCEASDGGFMDTDAEGSTGGDPTMDCDLSHQLLDASDYFIFDMQTHHVNPDGEWVESNSVLAFGIPMLFQGADCDLGEDELRCLGFDRYLDLIFLESDTTVAVLSGYPSSPCELGKKPCGLIVENDEMAMERDAVNAAAASQRMVNHCNIAPNEDLQWQLDHMQFIAETYGVVGGWKAYTGWAPSGGEGWMMDDPATGIPFIQKGIELGVPVFCVHKGPQLPGFQEQWNDARDMGVVAKMFPEAKFVIYHSGLGYRPEMGGTGEPYDPGVDAGVNNVIKTLLDNGLGPGSNLYAELGSLWANVMTDAVAAQHVIGKLLKHFGDDNVLWGSECIWYTSPQPQIEAFLALQISTEFQQMYGYPELTDERKRKILGLNAARLYGIDPDEKRCHVDTSALAQLKRRMDDEFGARRWSFQKPVGPTTRRDFIELVRSNKAKGVPG